VLTRQHSIEQQLDVQGLVEVCHDFERGKQTNREKKGKKNLTDSLRPTVLSG
jgi:hypothetical protein